MKKGEKIFDWILIGLAVIFVILSVQITPISEMTAKSEGFYPTLISVISLLLAVGNLLRGNHLRSNSARADDALEEEQVPHFNKDVLVMMGFLVLYAVLVFTVHYIIATLVFTSVAILYLSGKDWKTSLLVGFISTMMIVLVFKYGFSVILP